jgi:DNA primase
LEKENYPKIWNLFNVDNTKPVYIFEGFFDSIVIDNSIALNGADIPSKYMSLIQTPIFVFDNDKTGYMKARKYAEQGYQIFIYPENFKYKDFNEFYCKEKLDRKEISDFIKQNVNSAEDSIMLTMDRQIR